MEEKKSQGHTTFLNELLEQGFNSDAIAVMVALLRYYNKEKGYSYPSQPLLMDRAGIKTKPTLKKTLKMLEDGGYITREYINGKGYKYYLHLGVYKNEPGIKTNRVQNNTGYKNEYTEGSKSYPQGGQNHTPTNTNTITNTITNNNMSDSKESDHSPGAFKSDNNNSNKTTKSSKTKRATKVFEENSIEYQLSKKLYQYVLEEKPKTRKPDLQKWSKDFDLILRRDERSLEDLENVIDWIFNGDSNSSNFWKKNISSPGALRGTTKNGADKFAEIYSQMENDTNYYRPLQKELEKELPPITAEEFYDI